MFHGATNFNLIKIAMSEVFQRYRMIKFSKQNFVIKPDVSNLINANQSTRTITVRHEDLLM